jgi:hypothetical protein
MYLSIRQLVVRFLEKFLETCTRYTLVFLSITGGSFFECGKYIISSMSQAHGISKPSSICGPCKGARVAKFFWRAGSTFRGILDNEVTDLALLRFSMSIAFINMAIGYAFVQSKEHDLSDPIPNFLKGFVLVFGAYLLNI